MSYTAFQQHLLVLSTCLLLGACTDTVVHTTDPNALTDTTQGDNSDANLSPTSDESSNADNGNMTDVTSIDVNNSSENPGGISDVDSNMTDAPASSPVTSTPDVDTSEPATGTPATPVATDPADTPPEVIADNGDLSADPTSNPAPVDATADPTLNPAPVDTPPVPADTIADSTNTSEPATEPENTLVAPDASTVTGTPGQTVNCQNSLPCRWISGDNQFSVTITNADNIANQSRLRVQYSVDTIHDSQIAVLSTEQAVDSEGVSYAPYSQMLGLGNGGTPQSTVAGSTLNGSVDFDKTSASTTLANWAIGLTDNGLLRAASFTEIPVGSATTQYADCLNTLPCVWVSPNSDVRITLLSAGGFTANNRLNANFTIETDRDMTVAVDAGASASGIDGLPFTGRTHSLGLTTGYDKVSSAISSGALLAGSVNFFRTETAPTSLHNLSLIIYEDNPVPRWNPRFVSVPVQ